MKTAIAMVGIVVLGATMMYAQATRTWVSGVGDDANPCSRTAPCKTFAGAISKTAPGGEIDALDPGGFGALTITKSITLDGGGGQVASVLVAGTNGIVVAAAATDNVIIRNIRFDGLRGAGNANAGLSGIRFISGNDLNVENCVIFGFNNNGVDVALNQATQATVHVINTVLKNNGGVGIRATNAQTPQVEVAVDHTQVMLDNIGIEATQHSFVSVSNSLVSAATADGMRADDAVSADAQLTVDNSVSENNGGNGINAQAGSSISVGGTKLAFNGGCGLNNGGGNLFSFTQGANGTNRGHHNSGGNTCGVVGPAPQF
jgi:hypothetical protein